MNGFKQRMLWFIWISLWISWGFVNVMSQSHSPDESPIKSVITALSEINEPTDLLFFEGAIACFYVTAALLLLLCIAALFKCFLSKQTSEASQATHSESDENSIEFSLQHPVDQNAENEVTERDIKDYGFVEPHAEDIQSGYYSCAENSSFEMRNEDALHVADLEQQTEVVDEHDVLHPHVRVVQVGTLKFRLTDEDTDDLDQNVNDEVIVETQKDEMKDATIDQKQQMQGDDKNDLKWMTEAEWFAQPQHVRFAKMHPSAVAKDDLKWMTHPVAVAEDSRHDMSQPDVNHGTTTVPPTLKTANVQPIQQRNVVQRNSFGGRTSPKQKLQNWLTYTTNQFDSKAHTDNTIVRWDNRQQNDNEVHAKEDYGLYPKSKIILHQSIDSQHCSQNQNEQQDWRQQLRDLNTIFDKYDKMYNIQVGNAKGSQRQLPCADPVRLQRQRQVNYTQCDYKEYNPLQKPIGSWNCQGNTPIPCPMPSHQTSKRTETNLNDGLIGNTFQFEYHGPGDFNLSEPSKVNRSDQTADPLKMQRITTGLVDALENNVDAHMEQMILSERLNELEKQTESIKMRLKLSKDSKPTESSQSEVIEDTEIETELVIAHDINRNETHPPSRKCISDRTNPRTGTRELCLRVQI